MRRRGYTLIEMVVAMTLGAGIVGISLGALLAVLRTEQTGRNRAAQSGIMTRLADQFRSDVAVATHHAADVRKGEWQFFMAGDRVTTYRVLPDEIAWDERAAGEVVRQESFILPQGCSATIEIRSASKPATASLVITNSGMPHRASREMRVTAMLGKDHRFTTSPAGSH